MTSTYGGMTSDRVIGAKVIAFDETIGGFTEQSASEDLLFALRGGMGGNYGVVTEWELSVFEVGRDESHMVYSFKTRGFDLSSVSDRALAKSITKNYMDWLRKPTTSFEPHERSVWGTLKFLKNGVIAMNGQCTCYGNEQIDVCTRKCKESITHLINNILGGCGRRDSVMVSCAADHLSFLQAMWTWGDCSNWAGYAALPANGIDNISEDALNEAYEKCYKRNTYAPGTHRSSKSVFLPDETILDAMNFSDVALDILDKPICRVDGIRCTLMLDLVAGAMTDTSIDSAYGHRTPGFHAQISIKWPDGVSDTEPRDWARNARLTLFPLSTGESYQNYIDADLTTDEWPRQYFPTPGVFERLVEIKHKYNPTNVLDVPHALSLMIPSISFTDLIV